MIHGTVRFAITDTTTLVTIPILIAMFMATITTGIIITEDVPFLMSTDEDVQPLEIQVLAAEVF
jgi:hypothetical protein